MARTLTYTQGLGVERNRRSINRNRRREASTARNAAGMRAIEARGQLPRLVADIARRQQADLTDAWKVTELTLAWKALGDNLRTVAAAR